MKVLLTGVAGFIGYHAALRLLERGDSVIGIDNLNDYYDVSLKNARLTSIQAHANATNFTFIKLDLADRESMAQLFQEQKPQFVLHLAAQPGVRYSLINPHAILIAILWGSLTCWKVAAIMACNIWFTPAPPVSMAAIPGCPSANMTVLTIR